MKRIIMSDSPFGLKTEGINITLKGLGITNDDVTLDPTTEVQCRQINIGKKYTIQIATNKIGQFENNFLANLAEKDRGYTVPALMKRSKNGMLTVWEWPEEPKPLNLNTEGMNLCRRVHNG